MSDPVLKDLLDEILATWCDYVRFGSDHEPVALALWTVHTWVFEAADTTPYMWVTSAEPESGKTRTLEVAKELTREARMASSISASSIFRWIEATKPTLLLDEIDAVFGKGANGSESSENLRQVLNAGYRKGSPAVRVERSGKEFKVAEFEVFCPKAIAGLRSIPQTLASRSIEIRLDRKLTTEKLRPFRIREVTQRLQPTVFVLEKWAASADVPQEARVIPIELGDRAADIWEPLLVIGEMAGGSWPAWAQAAAVALSRRTATDESSLRVLLLVHLEDIWVGKDAHMFTETILERLRRLDEAPWSDWYGRQFTPRELAKLLKPFKVTSHQVRIGPESFKGYRRADLYPLWERYTPEKGKQAKQAKQDNAHGITDVSDVSDVSDFQRYIEIEGA